MSDGGFMRHPLAAPTQAAVLEDVFVSLTGRQRAMSDGEFMRHPLTAPTRAGALEDVFVPLTGRHLRDV